MKFEVIREIVGDAEVVFDVGAKQGDFAVRYLDIFPRATVYAFEPAPSNFRLLAATGNSRLRAVQCAVLDHNGVIDFHISVHDGSHSALEIDQSEFLSVATIEVPTVTLDTFCEGEGVTHIDFLKIDTNGVDLLVLEGGLGLFAQGCIDVVSVEFIYYPYYKNQARPEDITAILQYYEMQLVALYPNYYKDLRRYADAVFVGRRHRLGKQL